MKVTLNNKEYSFNFNSQIGPYYHYETIFGTSYSEDIQTHSPVVGMVRLIYAVLICDNRELSLTFEEFVNIISDKQIEEISVFCKQRFDFFAQARTNDGETDADEKEEEGKKD